ncbi:ethanolamine utilization protein EutH [Paenalkalicoccus suaedae]|uniref:Ethanolamine utilization protein EutH n=1 Tax=Paenalkalicoccus suaedae TaxID=2592382 RepID=A0A859FEJ7_9BACI|nr:ethanolamine utilization protein EutH [Paenalkalicoccus suaedae]QKS70655.1 ethanolamine utilization protein EutH [Paenalkalicoccus suaedae]
MWINYFIVAIILLFFIVGIVDKFLHNKYGYGKAFDDGFKTMGSLAFVMVGMISIAPLLAQLLTPTLSPLFRLLGADPAMIAGMFLAIDMGGYALASEMAQSQEAAIFSGIFLATLLGPTIVFTIPVALGIIAKSDTPVFAKGIMYGIIPIPIGAYFAGVVAGFPTFFLLTNLLPVILFVLVIFLGIRFLENITVAIFLVVARILTAVISIVLIIVAIQELTPVVLINGFTPFRESMEIVGVIVLALAGAFPLVRFISTVCIPRVAPLLNKTPVSHEAWTGFITQLAHSIPMYAKLSELDDQAKVMNIAFSVSGAFILGGHLGFTAAVEPTYVVPMMVGKAVAGICAILLAYKLTK